jgi:DNA repair protein RadC
MKKIKEIHHLNRPREKLFARGVEALSETELLAIILGSGIKGKNVIQVARSILRKLDKEGNKPDLKSLMEIEGLGLAKSCQIIAAIEFSRRRFFRETTVVRKAKDILPFISHIAEKKQENVLCITLNGANEIIGTRTVTIGLLNSNQLHPREVFADAISERAASVILAHNHPSGLLRPSSDDMSVTNRMIEAGKILGISVLDHIIVAKKGYLSFKEQGLI